MEKSPVEKINYLEKFAIIKDDVNLEKNNELSQVHNYPYKIVNQNKKGTWICLQSIIQAVSIGVGGIKKETINKSFWMKTNECKIVDRFIKS